MNYMTIEAEIDHGRVTVKEPEKLPARAQGLLIVLPDQVSQSKPRSGRVSLPIIQGDGKHLINPTPEELDASLWD